MVLELNLLYTEDRVPKQIPDQLHVCRVLRQGYLIGLEGKAPGNFFTSVNICDVFPSFWNFIRISLLVPKIFTGLCFKGISQSQN